ncbi:MAG TPA: hypothetical protein VGV65_13660, partial [Nocardioides sp.]|nr:hypothetical protein [Nocardioides sp.]
VKDGTLKGRDVKGNSIGSNKIRNGSLKERDFKDGVLKSGPAGPAGPAGVGRWALVDATGAIIAQSGGFTVAAGYPTLPNTAVAPAPDNSARANGNVYINAGENLANNGIIATIALQNTVDQNGDGVTNGRAGGGNANPEFSGEITVAMCGTTGVVACAPAGTNNTNHLVVSPRNSDGSVTGDGTRKRFYVVVTGDSSDRG